jgi:RNA polymerase sigma-70 factor, ECF subfamily
VEDKDLIKRLKKNDGKAFEDLFRKYFNALHKYANFYTTDSQMAEDMVHDIFFKIWESRRTLAIHSSIKSYLYRSVHNNCIQYLRHLKVVKEHSKKQETRLEEAMLMNRLYFETGLDRLFEKEIDSLVEVAISKLPDKTVDIFRLSRNQHYKNSEIALKLNITEKTVEYHISRALFVIRKELKDYMVSIMILVSGSMI